MDEINKETKKSFLSNKAYDTLRIIAAILPFIGTLYYGLSEIWHIPYGGEVQATISLIAATLSGILIKLSHDYSKYQKAIQSAEVITEEPVEDTKEESETVEDDYDIQVNEEDETVE